jgi:penicillin G amidase
LALALVVAASTALYALNVTLGFNARAASNGRIVESGLRAPVIVARDDRDIPHVVASSQHDLFFAQGFVEGSDRLFQMELTRRYATGTLAEVLGPRALPLDEEQRYYDLRDVARRQWHAMAPRDRIALLAFSNGVNAAMRAQALPVEFRLLLYRPRPWTPQDSLAVSLAVSVALADSWHDVLARDDVWRRYGAGGFGEYFPLSDERYDVSLRGSLLHSTLPETNARVAERAFQTLAMRAPVAARAGSNAWAAGATRTVSGRALLANDPHLDLTIPGLWYVEDLRAPGFHVAGASIPGAPGVLLGHNERIAWGATNADTSAMSLYRTHALNRRSWVRETFHVRFSRDVKRAYYRTAREFGVPNAYDGGRIALVRWPPFFERTSAVSAFLALDRAPSIVAATRVLATYRATAENFVLADVRGSVAYHMAGNVPLDPAWGRYVHAAGDARLHYPSVAFALLPGLPPSRDAIVVSANNRMYGKAYPYRLSAAFEPPYRAYRIAQLLHARRRYDADYFTRMQLDTVSPVDAEFARLAGAALSRDGVDASTSLVARQLGDWNGAFTRTSRTATLEHALRTRLEESAPSLYALLRALRGGLDEENVDADLRAASYGAGDALQPWGRAGAVAVEHPLAPLRFGFLNGTTLPGDGDEYTIRLQEPGFSQSFRAVWIAGDWDSGGIAIPSGESGEPGSGHYRDLSSDWIAGRLQPLPFSMRAISAATRQQLVLVPSK